MTLRRSYLILAVFACSWVYWLYLAAHTSMVLGGDAQGYDQSGAYLYHDGWDKFFKGGPQREPLYLMWIAFSMRLAEWWHVPYQSVQVYGQIIVLGLSQYLIYRILRQLDIRPVITAIVLLYWGFSPAIVNSGLSLYSEIATYPLVLAIVITAAWIWKRLAQGSIGGAMWDGMLWGLLLTMITAVKAVFEIIFLFSLLPFLLSKQRFLHVFFFILAAVAVFETSMLTYKTINRLHNGHFALTDRGSWALYGNTMRRMQPLTKERLAGALAYVPGEGFCRSLLSEAQCWEWSTGPSDLIGLAASSSSPSEKDTHDRKLINLSFKETLKNPAQYTLLCLLEGMKMFFWESTKIGFVNYPHWLEKIYDQGLFKNILRFIIFAVTLWAVFLCILSLRRQPAPLIAASLGFIGIYTAIHTPFVVLTRYAFPIVPLYLICIAYSLNLLYNKFHGTRK